MITQSLGVILAVSVWASFVWAGLYMIYIAIVDREGFPFFFGVIILLICAATAAAALGI
jgi:hypothetical protein